MRRFLSELRSESFEDLHTVFHYGDRGRKFYIVLEGEVYIIVPSADQISMMFG